MIGLLAIVAIGQAQPTMSAEEIQRRLETPITFRTDPVRLPVALDQIGGMVGVRVRCESDLQPAVVVVGVRNKPAKEVIQHLIDGVGAGTLVQNGTYHVGLRLLSPEQLAKQKELELKSYGAYLESKAKQLKIDEPLDPQVPQRFAAQAIFMLQGSPADPRMPAYGLHSAGAQSPSVRAAVGVLRAIGPEALRPETDKPSVVDMRTLDGDKAQKIKEILSRFEEEQKVWSAPFEPVFKVAAESNYHYINEDLLAKSLPLTGAKPDGVRVSLIPTQWGTNVQLEILGAGLTLYEYGDYLPKQRVYTNPTGEYFAPAKANQIKVPLGEKAKRLEAMRRLDKDGQPKPIDDQLMRQIADPWKNELIAFTRVQPLADVAEKLNLNVICFLADSLLNQLSYDYYGSTADTVTGDSVISLATSSGPSQGFRKKDDWLLGYAANPALYLSSQVDRSELGKFLNLALRPGALTFDQMLSARRQMGNTQLQVARQLARVVRPGFDSLNPVSLEVLDIFTKLSPAQLSLAKGSGLPIASLDNEMEKRVRGFIGYQTRRARVSIPIDSIDAPPTLDDYRKAKLVLSQKSEQGVVYLDGANKARRSYTPYAYYGFDRFENYRNVGVNPPIQFAERFNNRMAWPARMDTLQMNVDIPRKRAQMLSTWQYVTDVSVDPLAPNQLIQAIGRYFNVN